MGQFWSTIMARIMGLDLDGPDFAKDPRSRSSCGPTNISTRFDLSNEHESVCSRHGELVDGRSINHPSIVDPPLGHIWESGESSSIHMVKDLGFGAAANSIRNSLYKLSDSELLKQEAFTALQGQRKSACSSISKHSENCGCIESELRTNIERNQCLSSFDEQPFLPLDAFEALFDIKSIMLLVAERHCEESNEDLWSRFIQVFDPQTKKSRRRILGILVYMKRFLYLQDFIREEITDDVLPFKRPGIHEDKLSVMKNWDRPEIDLFFLYQRLFFVPFFDIGHQRLFSYNLDREIRLPWQNLRYVTSGGTGIVHRVEIHPSHHNFSRHGIPKSEFALKEIDAMDQKAYNEELSALEKTCAQVQKEKHLIKLLLTFRHGEKFYLLFEWADGSLEKFWKSVNFKLHDPPIEKWAAKQCLGLARAVSRIHGLRTWQKNNRSSSTDALYLDEFEWGRHGDIKPGNILWFNDHEGDRNLLVLSDLGLTRYHTQFSRSLIHRSQIDGHTRTYRPPELDIGEGISQLYDIWSLGCVFLEFCIWYLHDHAAVERFALERIDEDQSTIANLKEDKFFLVTKRSFTGRRSSELKPLVKKQIDTLRNNSTTFTRGLLDVIEDNMLCCNPKTRSKIDKICAELSRILDSLPE